MSESNTNLWARFFANEKIVPDQLSEKDIQTLMRLCEALGAKRSPYEGKGVSHINKMEARRLAVNTAMDMGIDLMAIKKKKFHGGTKPAMGRGLLDVWNEEYQKRFGSIRGTLGEAEVIRRKVVTKLAEQRADEKRSENNTNNS